MGPRRLTLVGATRYKRAPAPRHRDATGLVNLAVSHSEEARERRSSRTNELAISRESFTSR